ncbi:MAG: hypothetical protein DRJ09_02745 [Bacteroidetes bacterium]|nr:MAG: hypothetical protein DRJ09_02745 [Bacteroidota bacterium]
MMLFRKYGLLLLLTVAFLSGKQGYTSTPNRDSCLLILDNTIQAVLSESPDKYSSGQIDELITLTHCFNQLSLPAVSIVLLTDERFAPDMTRVSPHQKVMLYQIMAQACKQNQDFDHAEEYYKKLISYYTDNDNEDSILTHSFNLTDLLLEDNKPEKASLYFLLIHKIIDGQPTAFNNRSRLLYREAKAASLQGQYSKAIALHQLAIRLPEPFTKQINLQHRLALTSLYLIENKTDSAELLLNSIGSDSALLLPEWYLTKSTLFRVKKDFKPSSHYFTLFINETNKQNDAIDQYRKKILATNSGFINLIATIKPVKKEGFFSWGLLLLVILFLLVILTILIFIISSQRKQLNKRKDNLLKAESVRKKLLQDGEALLDREKDGVTTRLKRIEKEKSEKNQAIKKLKEQIEQTQQIKKKRDKANLEINFQVRSLLSSVIGLSSIFKTEFAKTKNTQLYKYVDIIDENASLLLNIIDAYHEYTSIDSGKIACNVTRVNVIPLIGSIVSDLEEVAKQRAAKLVFNSKKIPLLLSDEAILKKILTLATKVGLNNTNRGFVIIDIDLIKKNKFCTIKIQNTGHGFDPAYITDILKPFNREGLNYIPGFIGTGMEYPLIARLAELMKGEITIESAIEQGITFTLTLPATDVYETTPLAKPDGKKTESQVVNPWKGLKVLVVEDDVMNRLLFTKILKGASTLVIAENGEKALEIVGDFFREDEVFDLVLMDINLPQPWDGVKLKDKIKELFMPYKSIPFIAQTAYAMQGDREEFISKGFDEYISKPIMKKELIRVTNIALKKKATL